MNKEGKLMNVQEMVKESVEEEVGMSMVQKAAASPCESGRVRNGEPLNKSFKPEVDCHHQKSKEVPRVSQATERMYAKGVERIRIFSRLAHQCTKGKDLPSRDKRVQRRTA